MPGLYFVEGRHRERPFFSSMRWCEMRPTAHCCVDRDRRCTRALQEHSRSGGPRLSMPSRSCLLIILQKLFQMSALCSTGNGPVNARCVMQLIKSQLHISKSCLLYTSDAADERS